jgi:hypothetical protein
MASTIKIDNALQKRFAKAEQKKQKEYKKELKVYFLIVCEGEKTEPNYFESFPKSTGSIVFDLTFDGGGLNTTKVVGKAIELRDKSVQKYDRVWAVFDRDSFSSGHFNSAINRAKSKNIGCAWSNEAFELWYLLHFHNRVTAMSREDYKHAIEEAVNRVIINSSKAKKPKLFRYKKNSKDMYETLMKYGNQDQAIKWSAKLVLQHTSGNFSSHNPCTMVHLLVEELTGKSKSLNNEILKKYNKAE